MKGSAVRLSLVLLLTAAVYLPSVRNGLTNWDDDKYVVNQPAIRTLSGEAIRRHFTTFVEGNYHPLTMLSLSVDYAIGESSLVAFHVTNLLLHLVNTALVYWLCLLLMPTFSSARARTVALVAAALFGVHTMHVESVAWVAERKDVLYAAFLLSSLIAYVKYVAERRTVFYISALALFVGALLSKAMAVSLAVTVIAIDYLFERRWSRAMVLEKVPFLALAVLYGLVAVMAQRAQGAVPDTFLQIHERLLVACAGFVHYLVKLVAPLGLAPFYAYPRPTGQGLPASYWMAPLGVAAFAGLALALRRHSRLAVFCCAFFIVNVALVLQFFPVGSAPMADRYVYISSVAIFVLMGLAYDRLIREPRYRTAAGIGLVVYVAFLGVSTTRYIGTWKDSVTLWDTVIAKEPRSPLPYYNRGSALVERQDYQRAIADLSKALEFNPRYAEALQNRGAARKGLGDVSGALADFKQALAINPQYRDALVNAGNLMVTSGDYTSAADQFTALIALGGDAATLTDAYVKRAIVRYLSGDYRGAIADVVAVAERDPARARGLFTGFAAADAGNGRAACADWNSAAASSTIAREYAESYCR